MKKQKKAEKTGEICVFGVEKGILCGFWVAQSGQILAQTSQKQAQTVQIVAQSGQIVAHLILKVAPKNATADCADYTIGSYKK